ncbi:hypothetical protein [Azospirillum picis]|uniref:Protein involved in polysaccharide export with SLBB domain n=1 Tax=Azospirillum picis TaxID=488438 RepID=A0ABU0MPM5_9PROT|nr:hypothetical protein [Azospirillum picis]MBP2301593.1 protein involved in polysaccharide export with SLBB domain [Azospirillum picis]MDQ0535425.1 protein involved in polysaccharide export with SLBB domain [Azospirillum picis]
MNAISMSLMKTTQPADPALSTKVTAMGSLCEPGQTAVPLKPSATMLAAGARAGGVSVEIAWKIYQAMIHHTD